MGSLLFIELEAEHNRMKQLAFLGDPPLEELKTFFRKLRESESQLQDEGELYKVVAWIMYWRGFVRQTGETDVLTDDEADRHVRNRS